VSNLGAEIEEGTWLRVLKNRVLRIIFGRKKDEVTEELRKLDDEEKMIYIAHSMLFECSNEKNEMGGTCSMFGGEMRIQGFAWET
jgi:hypothetical protein